MAKNKKVSFKNKKLRQLKRKRLRVLLAAVTVLVLAAGALLYWQYSNGADDRKDTTTIGPNTKGNNDSQSPSIDEDQDVSRSEDNKTGSSPPNSTANLREPYGDFVSNHEPNLDGSPAPNTMESVCITTPGASCSISFKKDGTIKELPAQTADSEGAVYWTWTLDQYDLTEGTWTITAKATLGAQTKTAEDPLPLNVKP